MNDVRLPESVVRRVSIAAALLLVAVLVAVRLVSDGETQAPSARPEEAGAGASTRPQEVVSSSEPPSPPVPTGVLGGIRFVEVAERVGLGARGASGRPPEAADVDAGVAVVDLENDGDLDVLLTSSGAASGLFRNNDGMFTDITARSGLDRLESVTAAAFADVDADDDLDVFLGGPGTDFGRLMLNDGSDRFTEASGARGVVGRPEHRADGRSIRGVDFGDIDRDGDLDLVVTDWNPGVVIAADIAQGDASDRVTGQCHWAAMARRAHEAGRLDPTGDTRLFRNEGGHFSDVTQEWGLADLGIAMAFTPQIADFDGDGWPDLAITGDACTSRLFRNRAGERFVDVTAQAGVGTDENGMGSLIRDVDGDGRLDWLVTGIAYPAPDGECPSVGLFAGCSGNRVYLNRGRMRFEDGTDELGLRNSGWAWGVAAADFGNDGRLQVVITNGRTGPRTPDPDDQVDVYYDAFTRDHTRFFVRARGNDDFVDAADQVGIHDDAVSHAVVVLDHDRDGRLDLLIANAGAAPYLYRNVSTPRRHWVGIVLSDRDNPGNPAGVGSRVEVTTSHGTVTQVVHTSGSYEAQHPAELHVGLGAGRATQVRVWWPGEDRPQVVTDPPADRLTTITREP